MQTTMNYKNNERLKALLLKRNKVLERIMNFEDKFERFYHRLYEVSDELNNEIRQYSSEGLILYRDNPYERTNSSYFAMVQLYVQSKFRNFNLDNSENYPFIKFEGDEFSGYVKATIIFGNKINETHEYSVLDLIDKDKVFDILLNFLDTIYSLNDK